MTWVTNASFSLSSISLLVSLKPVEFLTTEQCFCKLFVSDAHMQEHIYVIHVTAGSSKIFHRSTVVVVGNVPRGVVVNMRAGFNWCCQFVPVALVLYLENPSVVPPKEHY